MTTDPLAQLRRENARLREELEEAVDKLTYASGWVQSVAVGNTLRIAATVARAALMEESA